MLRCCHDIRPPELNRYISTNKKKNAVFVLEDMTSLMWSDDDDIILEVFIARCRQSKVLLQRLRSELFPGDTMVELKSDSPPNHHDTLIKAVIDPPSSH